MRYVDRIFLEQLKSNLAIDGIPKYFIEKYTDYIDEIVFTKTRSRSILGSIKEVLLGIECHLADREEISISQEELNRKVNEWIMMPLAKMNLPAVPSEAMKYELEKLFLIGAE